MTKFFQLNRVEGNRIHTATSDVFIKHLGRRALKDNKTRQYHDVANVTLRKKQTIKSSSPKQSWKKLSSKNVEQIRQTSVTPQLNGSLLDSHILSDSESLDESYSTANVLSKSVDGTLSDIRTFTDMKDTISQLTNELNSTQMELENVILQNNDLHKQINKLTTEITLLKTLCHTPTFDTSASNSSTRKRHISRYSMSPAPKKIISLQHSINKEQKGEQIPFLEKQIISLQQQLNMAEQELTNLKKEILVLNEALDDKKMNPEVPSEKYHPSDINIKQKGEGDKKILIFGSQQCVGLASAISHARLNTKYEQYNVMSEIKSNALSNQILQNCINKKLSKDDILVICIGENDYSIKLVLAKLKKILDLYKDNMVLILSVNKNNNLNITRLNSYIRKLCFEYKMSHFVNTSSTLPYICKSINYIIDCSDYDKKYLNLTNITKRIASNKPSHKKAGTNTQSPKRGTIPYYFKRRICSTSNALPQGSPSIAIPYTEHKGTIPYYFPIIPKTVSLP
ncbi:hypothetical protein ACJJTC_002079 [Scirpophaga incertulas]